jgi:hypothetical protein
MYKKRKLQRNVYPAVVLSLLFITITSGCATIDVPTSDPPVSEEAGSADLPAINYFTARPETITKGQSAMLSWKVTGYESVAINPDIGIVTGQDTIPVSPSIDTTYTLTTVRNGEEHSASVTIHVTPTDDEVVGIDPATGRNEAIDFRWQYLSLAGEYQIQIAKDYNFTLVIYDSGEFEPDSANSPALVFPSGRLEAGHTYYWRARLRRAANGQPIHSPWSEVGTFTVSSGFPITSPK